MGSLSIWHWLIVLLVVVMIFGTKKLRTIGGDLGGAVRDFKKAMNDDEFKPAQQNDSVIEGEVLSKTLSKEGQSSTHV